MIWTTILIVGAITAYLLIGVGSSCLCALGHSLEKQGAPPPSDLQLIVAVLLWPYSMAVLLWRLFIYFATLPAKMIIERRGDNGQTNGNS